MYSGGTEQEKKENIFFLFILFDKTKIFCLDKVDDANKYDKR